MPSANQSLLRQLGRAECEVSRGISFLRRQPHRRFGIPDLPAGGSVNLLEAALAASGGRHEEVYRRRLADKSRALAEALERVRDGTYGICRECGYRIPRRRLQALPTATLCVPCQERRETNQAAA